MRSWLLVLGGLIVWAAHFFLLYAIAETTGASPGGRIAVVAITLACLLADASLLRLAMALPRATTFEEWRRSTTLLGTGLSIVAIGWQMLPALLDAPTM